MKRCMPAGLAIAGVLLAMPPLARAELSAESALEQLKSMAGVWSGPIEGEGDEAQAEAEAAAGPAVHEFVVSAGGTVVMETMGPGTQFEMINMYHLDGDDLLLTHYCSGGNQPRMRLNRETSTAQRLVFDYAGGTNHDPKVDQHIHSAELEVKDDENVISRWEGYSGGERAGLMTFHLARAD